MLDNEIITTVSPDMQKPPIYRLPDDGEKDVDIIAQPPIYKIPPGEDGGFEILLKEIDRLSGDNLQLKIDNQKLVDENLLLNKIIVDLEKKILELNQIIDEQIKRIDNLISSP